LPYSIILQTILFVEGVVWQISKSFGMPKMDLLVFYEIICEDDGGGLITMLYYYMISNIRSAG
jgi:hypothetical protein